MRWWLIQSDSSSEEHECLKFQVTQKKWLPAFFRLDFKIIFITSKTLYIPGPYCILGFVFFWTSVWFKVLGWRSAVSSSSLVRKLKSMEFLPSWPEGLEYLPCGNKAVWLSIFFKALSKNILFQKELSDYIWATFYCMTSFLLTNLM